MFWIETLPFASVNPPFTGFAVLVLINETVAYSTGCLVNESIIVAEIRPVTLGAALPPPIIGNCAFALIIIIKAVQNSSSFFIS
ncbi:hypothetical protein D3C85_1473020 [compost metagenome]